MTNVKLLTIRSLVKEVPGATPTEVIQNALIEAGREAENVAAYEIDGQLYVDADHLRWLFSELTNEAGVFAV